MSKLARADVPKRSGKSQPVNPHRKRKISSCPSTPTLGRMNPPSNSQLEEVSVKFDDDYEIEAPKRLPKKEKKKGGDAAKKQPKKERKGVSVWKFVTLEFSKDVNRKELKNKNVTNPFEEAFLKPPTRKISSSCPPSPVFALARQTTQLLEDVSEKLLDDPGEQSEEPQGLKRRRHGVTTRKDGMYHLRRLFL